MAVIGIKCSNSVPLLCWHRHRNLENVRIKLIIAIRRTNEEGEKDNVNKTKKKQLHTVY